MLQVLDDDVLKLQDLAPHDVLKREKLPDLHDTGGVLDALRLRSQAHYLEAVAEFEACSILLSLRQVFTLLGRVSTGLLRGAIFGSGCWDLPHYRAHQQMSVQWPLLVPKQGTALGDAPLLSGGLRGACYRVIRRIGAGGMGTVYEVERTTDGRHLLLSESEILPTVKLADFGISMLLEDAAEEALFEVNGPTPEAGEQAFVPLAQRSRRAMLSRLPQPSPQNVVLRPCAS